MKPDEIDLQSPDYTPVRLILATAKFLHAKNDAALARFLEIEHAQLSRIRHRKERVTFRLMVSIADCTGWSIQEIRELAGMPYDGVARLVFVAQKIGKRFPHLYSIAP